ncbi:MAG: FtsX-like permease family protein, partial [Cyclobacteriaceae bacterium]
SIWALITRKYITLLIVAFVTSIPFGYYMAEQWLQNFAFRITLNPWLFILGGTIIFLFAMLTVSWQSILASKENPTRLIRQE